MTFYWAKFTVGDPKARGQILIPVMTLVSIWLVKVVG